MSAESSESVFGRYREIVGDWDEFVSALARPLPQTVWENPLRAIETGQSLEQRWGSEVQWQRIEWFKSRSGMGAQRAYRISGIKKIGRTLEYLSGLLHVQEEVSLIPPVVLGAQPGESILDLCAAPGNKTAQMAFDVGVEGRVTANDRSLVRIRGMRRSLERLGLSQIAYMVKDGASFPSGEYDRVLADVPCGCEGTTRKSVGSGGTQMASDRYAKKLGRLQELLLEKAIRTCKPGGRIVYSTCTYDPTENECIVQTLLDRFPAALELEPVDLPGFVHSPGLTEWEGQSFSADMEGCLRAWPHQNDTGGFFVAQLRRKSDVSVNAVKKIVPAKPSPAEVHPALSPEHAAVAVEVVRERYGLGKDWLAGRLVVHGSTRRVFVHSGEDLDQGLNYEVLGLGLAHLGTRVPKLSTAAAMAYGHLAARGALELEPLELETYLQGKTVKLPSARIDDSVGGGFVIVRNEGLTYGLGVLRLVDDQLELESQYPKAWRLPPSRASV